MTAGIFIGIADEKRRYTISRLPTSSIPSNPAFRPSDTVRPASARWRLYARRDRAVASGLNRPVLFSSSQKR